MFKARHELGRYITPIRFVSKGLSSPLLPLCSKSAMKELYYLRSSPEVKRAWREDKLTAIWCRGL
jgi:hypothetical protein